MKIRHLAVLVSEQGGVANVVLSVDRRMREMGVDSVARSSRWARWLPSWFQAPRLTQKVLIFAEQIIYTLESIVEALRLRRAGVVVVSHGDAPISDAHVFHSCHKAFVKKQMSEGRYKLCFDPITWLILLRYEIMARLCPPRLLIAVSRDTLREVYEEYPSLRDVPGVAIPNGVDVDRFRRPDSVAEVRSRIRSTHGIREDDWVMVLVASRFRAKGVDTAIRSLPQLPDDVHLLVVGGDDPSAFREMAQDFGVASRVTFAGHMAKVEEALWASDLFLLPTQYEAFGLVGIEAMAAGLPPLMTEVGGIPEYLRDGENGFFISTPESVATVCRRLREDPALYERIVDEAARTAEQCSWEFRARDYIESLEPLARS